MIFILSLVHLEHTMKWNRLTVNSITKNHFYSTEAVPRVLELSVVYTGALYLSPPEQFKQPAVEKRRRKVERQMQMLLEQLSVKPSLKISLKTPGKNHTYGYFIF